MKKDVKAILMCIVMLFAIFCCASCLGGESTENNIKKYKYIVVNGVYYNVSDIDYIDYQPMIYSSDIIHITMVDGSLVNVHEGEYVLTNKEE